MHVTLHLTADCNFRCGYCYAAKRPGERMSLEIAKSAVDLAFDLSARENPDQSVGIIFFGGEPLLCREVITQTTTYARELANRNNRLCHFKITTNGSLLDETFLTDPVTSEIFVALSHDGVPEAHDHHRRTASGQGTFESLRPTVKMLLQHKPYSPVMMVTTPETAEHYADSVKFLFASSFRYLICSLNYGADWTEKDIKTLEKQYLLLADWYEEKTTREEKFYFSPFDVKIASHVFPGSCLRERCELGMRQISVAPSGKLFPCVQFVETGDDSSFCIGDVHSGIDLNRRAKLYQENADEEKTCRTCAIRDRCNHFCGCLNRQATGSIKKVSPVLCAHERMVLPIADKLAERLFKKRNAMFIQKQYNELFPLISLAEDRTAK